MINTRALACQILLQVMQNNQAFHSHLVSQFAPHLSERDKSFIVNLCFGTLRYYFLLRTLLQQWLKQPLKQKDADIEMLMLVGLYQLFFTDIAPYAILNETVSACDHFKKTWAKKLCNAILRQAMKHPKPSLEEPNTLKQTHPRWLLKTLQKHYPDNWPSIIAANQIHPPLTLRINLNKITRQDYLALMVKANLPAYVLEQSPSAIQVSTPVAVERLPGFNEGLVSVQDVSAQLCLNLLALETGMRVLDACAAPGGKAAHILENQRVHLLAIDNDMHRVQLLQDTFTRLQLQGQIQKADATQPQGWWDGQQFDRILLDAPCSGTGVIRRHPDIKILRTPDDIEMLASKQSTILEKLWPLLKPDGILVYATCSILPIENSERLTLFLKQHPDALHLPIMANWGIAQTWGRQILPGTENMDGFYYARIKKQA
jgi:16S rRNA (cytosine967-C5)-methyltransferase